jgi:hypothetical protein
VLRASTSALPDLDRSLLTPGGHLLSEVLRLEQPTWEAAIEITVDGLAVAVLARLVPLTGLVVALLYPHPFSLAVWGRRTLSMLPAQAKLTAFSALVFLACCTAGLFAASAVSRLFSFGQEDRTRDLLELGLKCLFLAPALLIQPITDLSRFSSRSNARSMGAQLVIGLEIFGRAPRRVLVSYLAPALAGYSFALAAAGVAYVVALGGPGQVRELLSALVHLIGLALLLAARVCWLCRAEHWARRTPALPSSTQATAVLPTAALPDA